MMFEDDEDDGFINPEVFHVVRRELYALNANLNVSPFKLRTIPTHTEDGIPIRKLYVANLPPKTTRTELFGLFAQYGFIKSCWVKMSDKGPDRTPSATYAFVTFSNPADAYKALQAPLHERILRGRNLKVSPADSWHQPYEDPDGSIIWKPQQRRNSEGNGPLQLNGEFLEALTDYRGGEENKHAEESEPYTMLDILNNDCLSLVLSYVPIRDLIRSERVSKRWQNMIQEYLQSIRMFKTSWWQHVPVTLTTAVLRRVLLRLGPSLLRLHIDHHWSALNDRTAHTVGKFCPNLEELKVVGMHTKNWNPLIYGCKNLKYLSFVSCNKLTDSSLVHIVKKDSCIERLTVANNTHITGLFLTGSNPPRLSSLEFYNCYSLQGTVLSAALTKMESLTTLKLDVGPVTMWKMVPLIISQLPRLHELSLSEYKTSENMAPVSDEDFCKALAGLTRLKVLNLSRNIHITNAVLKTVAQSCTDLESLNVSSCNSRKIYSNHPAGVSDEGVLAVCGGCLSLKSLDVSYLAALTDAGLSAATRLCSLVSLTARGNPALTAAPFSAVLQSCHMLEEIDACGCDGVSGEVIVVASDELRARPRPLALCLAGTAAALIDSPQVRYWRSEKRYDYRTTRAGREYNVHKLLTVNLHEDRSNPHLRADFVDRLFDDSSDGSFDDVLEHEDFDDFLDEDDDDLFLTDEEDDLEDYEDVLLQIHGQNILLI